jgi:soluble lytic murein transglycosylase-like protein
MNSRLVTSWELTAARCAGATRSHNQAAGLIPARNLLQSGQASSFRSCPLPSLRILALLLATLALHGCVSSNLATIAPQPSLLPEADVEAAATDFAAAPGRRGDAAPGTDSLPPVQVAAFAPLPPLSTGAPVDALIAKYARHYDLPEEFVRRVARRESNFNPRAYNRGHWGLMQIKHATARGMGYRGPAEGLFDAETNLIYAVKYLRGAYLVAGGDQGKADRLYQSGYYYHAKRAGLLDETGLGRDRVRKRRRIP